MGFNFCWFIKKQFERERVLLWAAERYDCGDAKGTGEVYPRTRYYARRTHGSLLFNGGWP
jgi:hypothetical protein